MFLVSVVYVVVILGTNLLLMNYEHIKREYVNCLSV